MCIPTLTSTMMTRQRSDFLKEIDRLKNQVDALKYKRHMRSSYGVLTFIFAYSFLINHLQRDPELQSSIATRLKSYGLVDMSGVTDLNDLNMFDRTMLATLYHYLVFKAISHRFVVSVFLGIAFMACVPGALHVSIL